jgi:hypothetical protein
MKFVYLLTLSVLLTTLTGWAQPANDDCSGAIQIPMGGPNVCIPITGNNTDATSATITPGCAAFQGFEVWYKFIVPTTGIAIIETSAAAGGFTDCGLAAYSGTCGALTLLDCDDDSGEGLFSLIELSALTPGETIYLAVWEYGGNAFGAFNICAYQPPPCADVDLFSLALDGCGSDNLNLTWVSNSPESEFFLEYGEAGFTQGNGTNVTGFTGVDGPPYTITGLMAGTSYDVYLYEVCQAVSSSTLTGTFTTTTGNLTNDDCIDAILLTVGGINECNPTTAFNNCASDSGVDHGCAFYSGGDVWFSFVAPVSGEVWVETQTAGGFTDGGLAVYSGDCAGLTLINCDDDGGLGLFSLVIATGLTPGETYYAAVWEYGNDAFGEFNICVYEPPTCPSPPQFSFFTQNVGPNQADINWANTILPGSTYLIEYGPDGFIPGTGTVITGVSGTDGPPVLISGLDPQTPYNYYWQAACSAAPGDSTNVMGPYFFTTTETCPTPSPFQITTTDAGFDFVTVTWPNNLPGATFVLEYGPQGYTQGSGTTITGVVGTDGPPVTISGLTESSNYDMYLLQICAPGEQTNVVGPILLETLSPPPANDNLCDATEIIVDAPPISSSNEGATAEDGEPEGDCWLFLGSPLESVWLYFVAPETGTASVTTDFGDNEMHDTHITIFELTGTCDDMSGLVQVGCDEDGGFVGPNGWTSIAEMTGLTPGVTYYVQVDGYNTQDGQFFIQVLTDPVGLDEIVEAGFMMYPNPAKDAIILSSDIINGAVVIALFDMNGRQVISETKNITKGEKTIVSLDGINPGVYMVRMTGSEGSSIRRLMVE